MKRTILYVEDDQDDFLLLQKAFHDVDQSVELVNVVNGYEIIKFLRVCLARLYNPPGT